MAIINGKNNNSTVNRGFIGVGTGNTITGEGGFIFGNDNIVSDFNSGAFGNSNDVNSSNSFAIGIGNVVNHNISLAFGNSNDVNSANSVALGIGNVLNGLGSFAFGVSNTVNGENGCAIGYFNTASGNTSFASGAGAIANFDNEWARAGTGSITSFQGQYGFVDYWTATTNATTIEIRIASPNFQRFTIANNSAVRFKINMLAKNSSTHEVKEWESTGLIKNVGGTTTMVGSSTTSAFADASMATATLAVSADNTNDSLKIDITGIAATNIRWYGKLEYVLIG